MSARPPAKTNCDPVSGPTTLSDLKKGCNVFDDEFLEEMPKKPPWFDNEKFTKGQMFFRDFFISILFAYFCALLAGFGVSQLATVLVYTGESRGAQKSRKRYLRTLSHLISWHTTDIFDASSSGHKSLLSVRNQHYSVRKQLLQNKLRSQNDCNAAFPADDMGKLKDSFSQFDMALVQCAFVGFINYEKESGICCTEIQLESYSHYWRILGHMLGLQDQFNICSGGLKSAKAICKEVEVEIVAPGLKSKSHDFEILSTDFMAGMRPFLPPWLSRNVVLAFLCPKLGLEAPTLSISEWTMLVILWVTFWICYHCTFARRWCNRKLFAWCRSFEDVL